MPQPQPELGSILKCQHLKALQSFKEVWCCANWLLLGRLKNWYISFLCQTFKVAFKNTHGPRGSCKRIPSSQLTEIAFKSMSKTFTAISKLVQTEHDPPQQKPVHRNTMTAGRINHSVTGKTLKFMSRYFGFMSGSCHVIHGLVISVGDQLY